MTLFTVPATRRLTTRPGGLLILLLAGCGGDDRGSVDGSPSEPAEDGGTEPEAPDLTEGLDSFTFVQPDLTVAPGEEWTACIRLPIPEEHRHEGPMYVSGFRSFFGAGTHHYFVYYNGDPRPETLVDEPTPCYSDGPRGAVIDLRSLQYKDGPGPTFGAPEGPGEYFLPQGFAYYLPSTRGYFVTDHHVFNTTPDTLTVSGEMTFFYSPPEEITNVLNLLNCTIDRSLIVIEPHSQKTLRGTCVAREPIDITVLSSHAHMYLKRFTQYFFDGERSEAEPMYESTNWDSPRIDVLDPPLHLEPGQGFTIQCEYENPTDLTITEGVGEDGEMCLGWNLYSRTNDPMDTPSAGGTVRELDGIGQIRPGGVCGPLGAAPCRQ